MVFVFSNAGEVVLATDSTSVTPPETEVVSPEVTVSSKLVTGPLTLIMCEWGDGVLVLDLDEPRLASSSSLGLSSFETVEAVVEEMAGGEAGTSRIDSLDFLRPPPPLPAEVNFLQHQDDWKYSQIVVVLSLLEVDFL